MSAFPAGPDIRTALENVANDPWPTMGLVDAVHHATATEDGAASERMTGKKRAEATPMRGQA